MQRKAGYSSLRGLAFRLFAVLLALLLASAVIQASGNSPLEAARSIIKSAFGTSYGRQQFFILAAPLILNGAAMLLGIRLQLYNFGLEGQLYMGAFVATAIGLNVHGPAPLVLLLMFVGGIAGGAFFALIPALMRIKAGISELLTTLLLNPLAIQWAAYIGMDAWRDTGIAGATSNATPAIPYQLPPLWGGLQIGLLIGIIVVVVLWIAFAKTTWGYEITSIGSNRRAANYAGMSVQKTMFIVFLISGAIAGTSGVVQLAGVAHRFSGNLSQSYGWLGITVAILAAGEPLALIPWGFLLALILYGGTILNTTGLSDSIVIALTGTILLLASIGEVIANYRLVRTTHVEKGEPSYTEKEQA